MKRVLALDHLEQRYGELSDILELDLQQSIPQSLECYAGVVLHGGQTTDFDGIVAEAIKHKIPIIFHVSGLGMLEPYKDRIKYKFNDYPDAHFVREDRNLRIKLRELFG